MLFSEMFKIIVNKVPVACFRGGDRPIRPRLDPPCWNGGHYLPNKETAHGPVAEIYTSVQRPRFFRSNVGYFKIMTLNIDHNCLQAPRSHERHSGA